jgi:hypothetical protein
MVLVGTHPTWWGFAGVATARRSVAGDALAELGSRAVARTSNNAAGTAVKIRLKVVKEVSSPLIG